MGGGVYDEGKLQTRPLKLPLVKQTEAGARWRLVQIYLPVIDTLEQLECPHPNSNSKAPDGEAYPFIRPTDFLCNRGEVVTHSKK